MLYHPSEFHPIPSNGSPAIYVFSTPLIYDLVSAQYGHRFDASLFYQCPPSHHCQLFALGSSNGGLPSGQRHVVLDPG